jgi:hypothetical protein
MAARIPDRQMIVHVRRPRRRGDDPVLRGRADMTQSRHVWVVGGEAAQARDDRLLSRLSTDCIEYAMVDDLVAESDRRTRGPQPGTARVVGTS